MEKKKTEYKIPVHLNTILSILLVVGFFSQIKLAEVIEYYLIAIQTSLEAVLSSTYSFFFCALKTMPQLSQGISLLSL